MISFCSAHQDTSPDIHVDLDVTLGSRDLRSNVDIDLMMSKYTYFDVYQREDLDGTYYYFCSSTISSTVIGKKKHHCHQVPLF